MHAGRRREAAARQHVSAAVQSGLCTINVSCRAGLLPKAFPCKGDASALGLALEISVSSANLKNWRRAR